VAGDNLFDLAQGPLDELDQVDRLPAALFEMLANVEAGARPFLVDSGSGQKDLRKDCQ